MVETMANVALAAWSQQAGFQLNLINKTQSPELTLPEGDRDVAPTWLPSRPPSCKTVAQRESPGPAGPERCPYFMAPPRREVKGSCSWPRHTALPAPDLSPALGPSVPAASTNWGE